MSRRGFTLAELMVATVIFTFVIAGAASMTGTVIRGQTRLITANALDNAATLARRSVTVALQAATFVETPGPGELSASLTAWSNVEDDATTALAAGRPRTYRHHCVAPDGASLHYYEGEFPKPGFVCGAAAAGARHVVVAGGPGYQVAARFYRPDDAPNLVQADISLALDKAGYSRSASLQAQVITRHAK